MNWFSDGKQAKVRRTINGFLNATTSVESHLQIDPSADQRDDGRIDRITPVVMLPLCEDYNEDGLNLGLTRDLSCEGMAISSLGSVPVGEKLAIGIGSGDMFCALLCECVRCAPIGYGFFESGVRILEVLHSRDFFALKNFANYLERNPPKNLLALVQEEQLS